MNERFKQIYKETNLYVIYVQYSKLKSLLKICIQTEAERK